MSTRDPWPLNPPLATCPDCPDWQVVCTDDTDKARKENRHDQRIHPARDPRPIPLVPPTIRPVSSVVATAGWWVQAIDAIADQPEGALFTIYEVLIHLPDPPSKNQLGKLTRDAHHIGLIEPAGAVQSQRPGTKQSMTNRWRRTAHNPDRNRARRTA